MYEQALNNASKNDKTSALLDRTHRLHQVHASIIVAKVGVARMRARVRACVRLFVAMHRQ